MLDKTESAEELSSRSLASAQPVRAPVILLSFLASAFLLFVLLPTFILIFLIFSSDFFQDLENSHMRGFAFTFITSPDDWSQTIQKILTPAIGALLPTVYLRQGGSPGTKSAAWLILAIAAVGCMLAFCANLAFSSNDLQERLYVENAFALPSGSADLREAFDAKLATARSYFSRLQESLLFIVMTILGVRAVR